MEKAVKSSIHFSLTVNDQIAHRLSDFCRHVGVSQTTAVNIAINYFFDDPKLIHSLMDGYREMGSLNREITHDFLASEDDAELHLAQYRKNTIYNYFE
ncbi:antitoxin [Lentilactobacillus curieae]|uniref:Antitoxin n=1 Tax=Lentilactobacillus curieae TaxID=1138822 RepID=A0A1S6QJG4_9LACO|nr:hypothetical protein [Lentilactobacillus curieae]AQW21729.1 antitoxin [Lentilactobacillus curieae]